MEILIKEEYDKIERFLSNAKAEIDECYNFMNLNKKNKQCINNSKIKNENFFAKNKTSSISSSSAVSSTTNSSSSLTAGTSKLALKSLQKSNDIIKNNLKTKLNFIRAKDFDLQLFPIVSSSTVDNLSKIICRSSSEGYCSIDFNSDNYQSLNKTKTIATSNSSVATEAAAVAAEGFSKVKLQTSTRSKNQSSLSTTPSSIKSSNSNNKMDLKIQQSEDVVKLNQDISDYDEDDIGVHELVETNQKTSKMPKSSVSIYDNLNAAVFDMKNVNEDDTDNDHDSISFDINNEEHIYEQLYIEPIRVPVIKVNGEFNPQNRIRYELFKPIDAHKSANTKIDNKKLLDSTTTNMNINSVQASTKNKQINNNNNNNNESSYMNFDSKMNSSSSNNNNITKKHVNSSQYDKEDKSLDNLFNRLSLECEQTIQQCRLMIENVSSYNKNNNFIIKSRYGNRRRNMSQTTRNNSYLNRNKNSISSSSSSSLESSLANLSQSSLYSSRGSLLVEPVSNLPFNERIKALNAFTKRSSMEPSASNNNYKKKYRKKLPKTIEMPDNYNSRMDRREKLYRKRRSKCCAECEKRSYSCTAANNDDDRNLKRHSNFISYNDYKRTINNNNTDLNKRFSTINNSVYVKFPIPSMNKAF